MEKLFKLIKDCLYKTIGRQIIPYFNLLTTLSDIECVLNNRPLTYCCKDNDAEVITPNHLLCPGKCVPSLVISEQEAVHEWEQESDEYKQALLNSLLCREVQSNKFKTLYCEQYLFIEFEASIELLYPLELEASRNGDAALNADESIVSANVEEANSTISNEYDVAEDIDLSSAENGSSSPCANNADDLVSSAPLATNELSSINPHSSRGRPMRSAAKMFGKKIKSWLQKGDL